MTITKQHLENSHQARRMALKRHHPDEYPDPPLKPWKIRTLKEIRLFQNDEDSRWYIVLGKNGSPMLATDAEVNLWLRLQACSS